MWVSKLAIVTFKGSDIETLGPENTLENEAEVSESGPVLETELLDQSASAYGMLLCLVILPIGLQFLEIQKYQVGTFLLNQ